MPSAAAFAQCEGCTQLPMAGREGSDVLQRPGNLGFVLASAVQRLCDLGQVIPIL